MSMLSRLSEIEDVMKNLHYDSYDDWVKNFALNLSDIWNNPSAANLCNLNSNTALVIGRGPSLKKNNHLDILAKSDFDGCIVCTDGSLPTVLESGVTPEKFPKFFVVSIEPYSRIKKFYENELVKKYGKKINGIFPTIASPEVIQIVKDAGIKIHWMHLLFDLNEGKKSFNYISALMTRAKNHKSGLPGIQTGGNAGTSAWFISWKILKCKNVGLIGINHGWELDDDWEKIISHGFENTEIDFSKEKTSLEKYVKKLYNPEFDSYCYLDPIYQFYRDLLRDFIRKSPKWVKTINATEGGSIFGERISCMKFSDFLNLCSK